MNKPAFYILAIAYSTFLVVFPLYARSEDVTDLQGKTYFNSELLRVEPDGLTFRHDAGLTKVYFWELPEAIRERYRYNQKSAKAFRKQQHSNQREHAKRHNVVKKQRPESQRKYLQDDIPVMLHNIVPIKDRSIKGIAGIMGNFVGYRGATMASGPVEGGQYRVNFDIQNNTMEDYTIRVRYGDYWKDIYIEPGETLYRQMISFTMKKSTISAEVGSQTQTYLVY